MEPVSDRRNAVFWGVYFMGLTMLLPYNMLITVSGYWDYKFRNVTLDNAPPDGEEIPPTQLQKEFISYLAIAANVPNAVCVVLHALFGHLVSMRLRVIGSQIGQILIFSGITVLAAVNSDSWQSTFLIVNLVAIASFNVFNAVFQGSVTSSLGPYPERYLGNLMSGTGMGGLVPSVVAVLILATDADSQFAGFYSFLFTFIVEIICLFAYLLMERTNYHRRYAAVSKNYHNSEEQRSFNLRRDVPEYWQVLKKAWVFHTAIFLGFGATLAVFPGVTVLIEPSSRESNSWNDIYFVPVCCFIVFNFGDYLGKQLATAFKWPKPTTMGQGILLLLTLSRLVLIPLLMFCNVSPLDRNTKVLFEHEAYYICFMIILAVSNGYITTIGFMFGPKVVEERQAEMTAAFMVAFLLGGCSVGAVLSAPLVKLL